MAQARHRLVGARTQAVGEVDAMHPAADPQPGRGARRLVICPNPVGAAEPHGIALPARLDAIARNLAQVLDLCRLPLDPGHDGAGQGMGGAARQRQRHGAALGVKVGPGDLRRAHGQGARLVEDHGIDLGQPFQRGAVLDQQPFAEQPAGRRRDDSRHRQPQRAGAGDDQHRRRHVHRDPHVAGQPQPAQEARQRQQVDGGRIAAARPVGDRGIAPARRFRRRDQRGQARQRTVATGRRHLQRQRTGQVHLARRQRGAGTGGDGHRLARQQRAVDLGRARRHHAVRRNAATGTHQDQVAGAQVGHGHGFLGAVAQQDGARHLERGQLLGGGPGHGAGAIVEIAPDQKEEAQHHHAVEIGVRAAVPGLEDGNGAGEDQRQRDRHVHAEPSGAQRPPGAGEEGLAGKGHGRQGDGARDHVEQVAGRGIRARPDRDRQDHDVHGGKARDPDPHQQVAPLPVGRGGRQRAGVEFMRLVADAVEHGDEVVGRDALGIDDDAAQGQVHPRGAHARNRRQRAFHVGDAGRAMGGRQRQDHVAPHRPRAREPPRQGGHVAGGAGAEAAFEVGGNVRHHFTRLPA